MADNATPWVDNIYGAPQPLRLMGKFQAGSDATIKMGEMLELSGGNWIPLDADQGMSAVIAIANVQVRVGDLAGYYEIIVPRPGDRFIFPLDAAVNDAMASSLYWISSEEVTVTTGSNVLGYITGDDHYPKQGHGSVDITSDRGTTLRAQSRVIMSFKLSVSYYAALFV